MAQNPPPTGKRTLIPPPEVFMSDDILDSTDPGHTVTKSTPALPLVKFTGTTTSTTKGTTTKQKSGKRARPANVEDLAEADRDVSLPGSSTSSLFGGEDDYDIQDTPRPDIHHRDLFTSQRGGRLETSSSLTEKMNSMQNNLLIETIENLSKEIREMHTTINSLATNLNTVRNQNQELKASHQRMEKHILRIGSSQAQARSNETTSPATNANKVPQTNKRQTTTQPKTGGETQADSQPGVLPVGQDTWATVAKKGKAVKENPNTPAKRMERTIIVHRSTDAKNDETDIYHMRDTINTYLNKAKAPASLTISGIQWNRRGNLTLTTLNKFTEEELAPHLSVIEEQVKKFDESISMVGKQETWTKLIVHGVDTHQFPDSEEGMKSLQTELETFNEGLGLASTPRYLTHPDKRVGKAHSSVVIAMKDKAHSKRLLKHGVVVFGQPRRTAEYFSARPTDQCTKCQQFGHHWQRCNGTQVCGICADKYHDTRTHICTTCNSRTGCDHKPAKCANCPGKHRSNSTDCEVLQAMRNKTDEAMEEL
jgi:hypothetical protein